MLHATFEVDQKEKKKIFFYAGKYCKKFKTNLIDNFPLLLEHPPLTYAEYIDQKVWDMFIAKRLTPEWEALRKVQQERRTKNINLHKLSQISYVDLV